MRRTPRTRDVLLAAAAALAVPLSACTPAGGGGTSAAAGTVPSSAAQSAATSSATVAASSGPFGAGCAALAPEGAAGVAAMAGQPVVTAAAANPALGGFASAARSANLVDSLNTRPDITVLLPADQAFSVVPKGALASLTADTAKLTAALTHHVLQGRLTPDQLAGQHTTLNNDQVTIEGSGQQFTVPADQTLLGKTAATVICGNVQTANATVYVIDQVLNPAAR